jgi:hypothetical protein
MTTSQNNLRSEISDVEMSDLITRSGTRTPQFDGLPVKEVPIDFSMEKGTS